MGHPTAFQVFYLVHYSCTEPRDLCLLYYLFLTFFIYLLICLFVQCNFWNSHRGSDRKNWHLLQISCFLPSVFPTQVQLLSFSVQLVRIKSLAGIFWRDPPTERLEGPSQRRGTAVQIQALNLLCDTLLVSHLGTGLWTVSWRSRKPSTIPAPRICLSFHSHKPQPPPIIPVSYPNTLRYSADTCRILRMC